MSFGEAFEREKLNAELKETLEKADLTMKFYLKDEDTIGVQKVKEKVQKKVPEEKKVENITDIVMEKVKEKEPKKSWIKKTIAFVSRVGEELFDNVVREFLKKKMKWNYSVYNDAKGAMIAAKNKDYQTAAQKGSDSVLYMFSKLPANTKKIIKNTKNTAIKEAFAMGEQ